MLHWSQHDNTRDCHGGDHHLEVLQGKDNKKAEADDLKLRHNRSRSIGYVQGAGSDALRDLKE